MYRDVVQFWKRCVACNMRKLIRQRPPLQEMHIPKYPFEQIVIDTAGSFPESYSGNRYIINVIDLFSGWPESFATPSKSAEAVAQTVIKQCILCVCVIVALALLFRIIERNFTTLWSISCLPSSTLRISGRPCIIRSLPRCAATKFGRGGGILVRQTHLPQVLISPRILATLFWKS